MTRLIVSIAIVFLVAAVLIGRLFTPRQRVRRLLRRVQDPNRGQSATTSLRAMGDKALLSPRSPPRPPRQFSIWARLRPHRCLPAL
jgi:hypothetical protein